ncbi:MAG: GatB/YqeY domain-containing protein [Dehalococcoidia bacterium]|nr:GatB/YqeY domain-containing protein [Dehalococcoidia bacterium]
MDAPLKIKLNEDLRQALRSGEQLKCSVIRMLLSAMNYAEIARQATLADPDIIGVIGKEIKQRRESIEAYKNAGRPELAAKEEAELAILQVYMPAQMSRAEIVELVKKVVAETGAAGPRDKNKVMPKLMPLVRGKADGAEVNSVVSELLGG